MNLKEIQVDEMDHSYFRRIVAENSYSDISSEQSSFEGKKTKISLIQSAGSSFESNQKSNFSVDSYYFYQGNY